MAKGQSKSKSQVFTLKNTEKRKKNTSSYCKRKIFSKGKVDELQHRLREKELQLNRIKFSPNKDEFNVQKIS